MRLKDKIIFVPGGNGLIGKAIVNQIKVEGGVGIIGDLNIESNTDADYIECNVLFTGTRRGTGRCKNIVFVYR